mmetsp:Transcript_14921/g.44307  ORF Transcript_14921/g.44307 Transcript_14921/m.44307 type:complete len:264 (-) Transcript_14921:1084-1875(-)
MWPAAFGASSTLAVKFLVLNLAGPPPVDDEGDQDDEDGDGQDDTGHLCVAQLAPARGGLRDLDVPARIRVPKVVRVIVGLGGCRKGRAWGLRGCRGGVAAQPARDRAVLPRKIVVVRVRVGAGVREDPLGVGAGLSKPVGEVADALVVVNASAWCRRGAVFKRRGQWALLNVAHVPRVGPRAALAPHVAVLAGRRRGCHWVASRRHRQIGVPRHAQQGVRQQLHPERPRQQCLVRAHLLPLVPGSVGLGAHVRVDHKVGVDKG